MQRYFVQLSFKGTRYHGWQVQPNALSVQEVIEKIFSVFLREAVSVTGAGRTDTGVHASFFVLHFDSAKHQIDPGDFIYRINRFLPSDIAVQKIHPVPPEAHARFSALSRTYRYYISRQKDPFLTDTRYFYSGALDVERMNEAAKILFGFEDFTSFSRVHTDVKTKVCQIMDAGWEEEQDQLVFTIQADRFLRNMVRAVVGTLLEVGRGKETVSGFREIIMQKNRQAAGPSAPAKGLFLTHISYPETLIRW